MSDILETLNSPFNACMHAADCCGEIQSLRAEVTKLRADAESLSAEREACAKLCEMVGDQKEGHSLGYRSAAWQCAALIRGRGANNA